MSRERTLENAVMVQRHKAGADIKKTNITTATQSDKSALHFCNKCGSLLTVEDNGKRRDAADVAIAELSETHPDIKELVKRLKNMQVTELGIECHECGWWFHSLFDDKRMKRPRANMLAAANNLRRNSANRSLHVKFARSKQRCGAIMEAINLEWRPVFGRTSPAEQLAKLNRQDDAEYDSGENPS